MTSLNVAVLEQNNRTSAIIIHHNPPSSNIQSMRTKIPKPEKALLSALDSDTYYTEVNSDRRTRIIPI